MNFSQVKAITIPEGAVKQITDGLGRVLWGSGPIVDYTEPFYIRPLSENAVVSIRKKESSAPTITVEYSMDGSTWQTLGTTSTTVLTINVSAGSKVWLRASTNSWSASWSHDTICVDKNSAIGGNIMSLLYGSNFTGDEVSFPSSRDYIFRSLFNESSNKIVDASELILPATTLTNYCYQEMFSGCSLLTTAPTLPATILAQGCYNNMFYNCYALTQAPVLPATTLVSGCYSNMFAFCQSLTSAPTLPATTLAEQCYEYMFFSCGSLTTAPALPATTLTQGCYYGMFSNCYALTQAPVLPATTLVSDCYVNMFTKCSSLTQAPVLPATTLVSDCYVNMFQGCSSLNYIECLAVNDADGYGDFRNYCGDWVDGVSSSGTFIASDNYAGGWYWGKDGVPENWTTETESGNPFEPAQGGGGSGTQIYQSNGLTVYEMGSEQGGYQVYADGSSMMFDDEYNPGFGMMKISADQGNGNTAYMTPYLGGNTTVTAYISHEVPDDGTCPFSYSQDEEYDREYALMNGDDGNQISPYISDGYCRWVKFAKPYWDVSGSYITMNF